MREVVADGAVQAEPARGALVPGRLVVYRAGETIHQSQLVDLGPPANLGATVLDGDPKISARTDYAEGPLTAGVFQSTPGTALIEFPFTEYATILNGEVELSDQSGNHCRLRPGDSYLIRQGSVVTWHVSDAPVQKTFFYRVEAQASPAPITVYRAHGEVRDAELTPLGDPEALGGLVLSGRPEISARVDFSDGTATAGVFQATPASVRIRFPFTELATVTKGTVTVNDNSGEAHRLLPGDSYFVEQGSSILWQVAGNPVQKSFFNVAQPA